MNYRLKLLFISLVLLSVNTLKASKLIEVSSVTDRIICLHFDDGYVIYHDSGETLQDDSAVYWGIPFDTVSGMILENYSIQGIKASNYTEASHPLSISLKGKTRNYPAKYPKPPYIMEYWVYLELPQAIRSGSHYRIEATISGKKMHYDFHFDDKMTRSDAIKVNQIGYLPDAGMKYAYLHQWIGTEGSVDYSGYSGKIFNLIDANNGEVAYSGKIAFRQKSIPRLKEGRYFNRSSVWECNFSDFKDEGQYKVQIPGIGTSLPFFIGKDVYNRLLYTSVRGFYHQRSGPERGMPYSEFPKPVDHMPGVNDFEVVYSNFRFMDRSLAAKTLQMGEQDAGFKMIDSLQTEYRMRGAWGGWYDAGDWDRHAEHLVCANMMLTMFELAPEKFYDGQFNLPESGNGIPDIVDEAKWEVDMFLRLKGPTGGISGWIETSAHPDNLTGASGDVFKKWFQSAEEPAASFYTAALAAQLSNAFTLIGEADSALKFLNEAEKIYKWAYETAERRPYDYSLQHCRARHIMAAGWLYKITGEAIYQEHFKLSNSVQMNTNQGWIIGGIEHETAVLPFLTAKHANKDMTLHKQLVQAYEMYVFQTYIKAAKKRACRFGSDPKKPIVVGWHATTPESYSMFIAGLLTGKQEYIDYGITTCDYFMGGNAGNILWMTGIGENDIRNIFQIESWYDGIDAAVPGLVPYGHMDPSIIDGNWKDEGWWSPLAYYNSCIPAMEEWPIGELEFESRYAPMIHEFTIWQNMSYWVAAAAFLADENTRNDYAPPTIPKALLANKVTSTSIKFKWQASLDNDTGVKYYKVYQDDIFIGISKVLSYKIKDLEPETEYFFTLRAVDNNGNVSQHSNKLIVRTR